MIGITDVQPISADDKQKKQKKDFFDNFLENIDVAAGAANLGSDINKASESPIQRRINKGS